MSMPSEMVATRLRYYSRYYNSGRTTGMFATGWTIRPARDRQLDGPRPNGRRSTLS
jgi:hypothetical protein